MLYLKFIRANTELVRQAIINKNEKANLDELLKLDDKRRKLQFDFDNLKAEQNRVSQEIALRKRNKEDAAELISRASKIAEEIKRLNAELNEKENELQAVLMWIPNVPHKSVPVGKDESANLVIREWGKKPDFTFTPKDHLTLAEQNCLLDMQRGAKITGTGFPVYTGRGAGLERKLINFMLDFHLQNHGYEEMWMPFIVNRKTMTGTGQLPKLENDMYRIEEEDYFLIPTAEVPITNYYADEILPLSKLPIKMVGYTPCFRREAGSYGKETKGLQRVHQFNKVEMVRFVHPTESYETLEEMVKNAEAILQTLGLHYRVVELCTGELSFAGAKTYDLEVWAPGTGRYLEVSSVSNFEDFQARRAGIRFRDEDGKVKFVHTLNGSGLATPRTMIALLETYQNEDGTLNLPNVLSC
ncbi:MAG TPA: serine--tRNA ligase [Candidatus Cloacimonadota bacterium]|nr:serine--tRNA ligase [Candidatus Cloacimonadota bacterium]HOV17180.1 serine--tRNA ligase [Candidatus Cloacimonadota bacterium]HQL15451.1 serine--tRNA ligase [Candidatus Cloacimonadota bacterium]